MQKVQIIDLGLMKYADALAIQTQKFNELIEHKLQGRSNSDAHILLLCEHHPVITLGKAANEQNILLPEDFIKEKGIEVFHISRGGDVTFHGPGQITGYPILDLEYFSSDIRLYMRMLEEVMIRTIAEFGITGYRIPEATGVWVNSKKDNLPKKIAAFGVKTSRWVTMHGFALNVDVDLNYFNYINPCGFTDKGVTNMISELSSGSYRNKNNELNIKVVKKVLLDNFAVVFGVTTIAAS